jgi:hypothetical protein
MQLEIFKADHWYNYLVRIDDDVFEMSENANSPNGVNMYFGPWKDCNDHCKMHKLPQHSQIPIRLAKGIAARIIQQIGEKIPQSLLSD